MHRASTRVTTPANHDKQVAMTHRTYLTTPVAKVLDEHVGVLTSRHACYRTTMTTTVKTTSRTSHRSLVSMADKAYVVYRWLQREEYHKINHLFNITIDTRISL